MRVVGEGLVSVILAQYPPFINYPLVLTGFEGFCVIGESFYYLFRVLLML